LNIPADLPIEGYPDSPGVGLSEPRRNRLDFRFYLIAGTVGHWFSIATLDGNGSGVDKSTFGGIVIALAGIGADWCSMEAGSPR